MDTVFINGKIYIQKDTFCQAMLVSDGLICATGSNREIQNAAPAAAAVVDLKGRTVIPGLNDSHIHLTLVVDGMMRADLRGAKSIEEVVERCKAFLRDNPEACKTGLLGYGWNQDLFVGEQREPNRYDLDRVSTDIPIMIERVCGHVTSVNTKMMELAEVFYAAVEYPGGSILKDADGMPIGVFTENAAHVFRRVIPPFTIAQYESCLPKTADKMIAAGITSVQANDARPDVGDPRGYIRMLGKLYEQGSMKLRYHHQLRFASLSDLRKYLEEERKDYYSDPYLTFGPLKLFKDGSLGGRTALMRKDYEDDPGNAGVCVMDTQTMIDYCKLADEYGMQVAVHAIGDQAIADTVAAFESVLHEGKNPLRHAIIHCQITDLPLLERIKADDICIQYQPIFLNYDLHVVEDRVGRELAQTSYAFHTAQQMGIHVSYGTDAPVEDFNPFENLYSAVARQDLAGYPEGGFCTHECVSVADAVDAYTIGSAYQQFMEDKKGRIKPGYYADFVVLDTDIFTCEKEAIKRTKPCMTVIGGEIVFCAETCK